ncbi:putative nicotinate-nucleotide pyrophosphorylase [carboxylating] [Labrenzia sp. THAF191b]|uniref:carboxylating nicotinate-nucleotide diphosphorylase n=2 Tax=Stappiaceae TaxID=2821832 RepID=UPI001267A247|nr:MULTISPECIES: carboxylating nicotinate-nucleotide diphosphorylase [Stappiaceae]MCR9283359.1 carboxylating nicotinate-nucleotide diphosphorylase [Paracoccaceae bacterium]QFS97223.1 putative nicotinate-nucleotide pyrophosphorylase [carboxylating] [Labrenzia sp. THAF191b]QFT03538.1 putative nicotinate-nucleotide pyrophosphorylase [carboxylating] [Labrenzia sp. THAF191a]QFT15080.1 putative nicotinate-nucleotide pyrophosphorylase [carboxylating] [Labrenzia sp. THAF187b]QFT66543.1 putative nicoti
MNSFARVPDIILEPMVRNAIMEDLGGAGDVTTRAVLPETTRYRAELKARQAAVVSGMQVAALTFRLIDPTLKIETVVADGSACKAGDTLLKVEGLASSILAAERVALNFAGRLSGTATLTAAYGQALEGTGARITCTRKTTPGMKLVEKLAVLHGGGHNHRFSLSDAILIKDNHIAAAGGIRPVLEAVKRSAGHMVVVEIEIDGLGQLDEVLEAGGADVILFDNMSTQDMAEAVRRIDDGRMKTEASGNVRIDRLQEIAATGVDYISSGALTHSAGTVDFGLDF